MILLDANILLYAYNADAPEHTAVAAWLEGLFASGETIGLPWVSLWAFLRISTNARLWPSPLPVTQALEILEEWLSQPGVVTIHPGQRHIGILERLMIEHRVSGPRVTDTVLTALALEQGAVLASTDQDFRRFPELRWVDPLHPAS